MNNKELFLIIGLTIILSVVVTITTGNITGATVVGWDDSIGGYPASGYSAASKATPSSSEPQQTAKTTAKEVRYIVDKSGLVDLLKNAEMVDGASTTSCQKRCTDRKKDCVMALFSDSNNGAQLISCSDKSKQHDNRQYKVSCACVEVNA